MSEAKWFGFTFQMILISCRAHTASYSSGSGRAFPEQRDDHLPQTFKCVVICPALSMCLHGVVISKHWRNFHFTLTKPQGTKAVLLQRFTIAPTTGRNKAERSSVLLSAYASTFLHFCLLSGIQSSITTARKLLPSIIH